MSPRQMVITMPFNASAIRSAEPYVCPVCGDPYEPYNRAEGRQVYCSAKCRKQHHEGQKAPSVQNPDKLTRKGKILARLRKGPATGLDLLRAGGGVRYGARILELRQDGYEITTKPHEDHAVYTLEE